MKTQGHLFSGSSAARTSPARRRASSTFTIVQRVGSLVVVVVGSLAAITMVATASSRPTATWAPTTLARPTTTIASPTTQPDRHRPPQRHHDPTEPKGNLAVIIPAHHAERARTVSDGSASTTTTIAPVTRTYDVALRLSANIVPVPDFLVAGAPSVSATSVTYANPCVTASSAWPVFSNDPSCTQYVLSAINHARALEGIAPMALPTNWYTLTPAEQLFVVADLERTARGLAPYLGLNPTLDSAASRAAVLDSDPDIAPGFALATDADGTPAMDGAWSGGFSVLAADYVWMYDDGWGGTRSATSNLACTSASSSACWAHRAELLGTDPGYDTGVGLGCADCEMGAGYAVVRGGSSYVDIIEAPASVTPPMVFTWAGDVAPYFS